jgi:hypothetical protein
MFHNPSAISGKEDTIEASENSRVRGAELFHDGVGMVGGATKDIAMGVGGATFDLVTGVGDFTKENL